MKKNHAQVIVSGLLLIGFFYVVDAAEIISVISTIDIWTFLVACIFSVCGNFACAFRWTKLLNYNSRIEVRRAFKAYFESISFSTVIPLGIIGGDFYRSVRIIPRRTVGAPSSKMHMSKEIILSVIMDRIHGFWALCLIAAVTILAYSALFELDSAFVIGDLKFGLDNMFSIYLLFIIVVVVTPWISSKTQAFFFDQSSAQSKLITNFMIRSKLKTVIFTSIISQLLFAGSFFYCLNATNVDISIYQCFMIVPIIFLCAAVPLSLAGFGPREYGAAIILSSLGFTLEKSVASSILFGLTITLQGIGFLFINLIFSSKDR